MGLVAGVAGAASGLIGGIGNIIGSGEQASALKKAAEIQQAAFKQAQGIQQPYLGLGQQGISDLGQLRGLEGLGPGGNPMTAYLTAPFNPTMSDLEKTPGYQFTLQQGIQGTQNQLAAAGLGYSGAALAGDTSYTTGLASQTYNQQLQNYWLNRNNMFNILYPSATYGINTGAGAANALTNAALSTGAGVAQSTAGAGQAQAAGLSTGLQSLGGALSGGVSGYYNALLAQAAANKIATTTATPGTGTGAVGGNSALA